MYLVGSPHPNRQLLEEFFRTQAGQLFVTSAEVYQEVIHRYLAIDRLEAIDDCFTFLDRIVESVHPIGRADVELAKGLAMDYGGSLSSRDCLHLATMELHKIHRILTLDEAFQRLPGIESLPRR